MFSHHRWNLRLEVIVLLISCILRFHNATSAAVMENKESVGRNRANSMHSVKAVSISECPPLPRIEGGGYECDHGYKLGSMCTFQCGVGYRIVDQCISHNKCIDDGDGDLMWKMTWAQCERMCQVPNIAKSTAVPAIGQWVQNGKTFTFTCEKEHHTTDKTTRSCDLGTWKPSIDPSLKCYKDCDAATLISNNNVLNADASQKTGLVNHKDSVTFTCKSNYNTESGTAMTVMCSDSKWMSHSYTNDCKSKCAKPNVGQLKQPSALTNHHSTNEVTFECNSGYAQKKGQTRYRKCNNGVWDPSLTNSAFECAQSCMVSYQLIGGKSEPAKDAYVKFGDVVTYSCYVGYSPVTTGTGLTRTCGTSGKFEGVVMDTTTLKCFSDCVATSVTGATGHKKVIDGGTVDYTCGAGYEADGTLTATCNDGLLSTVKCKAKCKVAAVPNGSGIPAVDSFVSAAETVVYSCEPGFTASGELTLTCTNSTWVPTLQAAKTQCIKQCALVQLDGADAKIATVIATAGLKDHLTKVDYECVTATHTEKPGQTTNQSHCIDGEWKHGTVTAKIFTEDNTLVFIECEKKCLMSSFAGNRTSVSPSTGSIATGAKATYTCTTPAAQNFLIGGIVSQEVNRTCNDGTIDITGVQCDSKCQLPTVASLVKSAGFIDHNPTVAYVLACATDYIIDPPTTVKCNAGTLAPPITAGSVSCKQECTVSSTEFLKSGGSSPVDGTKIPHAESITYTCNSGYSSPHVLERTCNDGSFSPTVSATDPLCYTDCAIPSIANLAKPSTTSPNSATNDVQFACVTGFHHGSSTMKYKCNAGKWVTAPTIDCTKMCQVVDVDHATESSAAGSYVKESDSVTYACINSYTPSGTMKLTCTNSAWVPTLQAAKTQCIKRIS